MRHDKKPQIRTIGEFHFSPLEHALFTELQDDAQLDAHLNHIFALADHSR